VRLVGYLKRSVSAVTRTEMSAYEPRSL